VRALTLSHHNTGARDRERRSLQNNIRNQNISIVVIAMKHHSASVLD